MVHGIEENDNENTDALVVNMFNDKLNIGDFNVHEIQRSHRLGPKLQRRNLRSARPNIRPIIVKFTNYRKRQDVFKSKRSLKGTNLVITENLTHRRYSLLKASITKLGQGKVWPYDGRILTKVNNQIIPTNTLEHLDELFICYVYPCSIT